MKKLSDLSWLVDEQTYRDDPALSYSILSRYDREGFSSIPHLYDKISTPSLLFGSLVDTLLTDPKSFNEAYLVSGKVTVTDQVKMVLELLHAKVGGMDFDSIDDSVIHECCKECNYYVDDKWANKRKKEIRAGKEYYDLITVSQGKIVISTELYQQALACKNALVVNGTIMKYFVTDPLGNYENYYQLKFKGRYKNVNLKCMVDCLHVDHVKKIITPIDLKTSSKPEYKFPESFATYRYGIQAQLYWEIIHAILKQDDFFKDYTLEQYRFIVVSKETLNPLIWEFNQTTSTNGYILGDITYRGWREIAVELNEYLTTRQTQPNWVKPINSIEEYYGKDDNIVGPHSSPSQTT